MPVEVGVKDADNGKRGTADRPEPNTCASCFYWARGAATKPGACMRFPRFESKRPNQWCGEYQEDATRYPRS